jgi:crossover junction endodeoxyribonuclease RusA
MTAAPEQDNPVYEIDVPMIQDLPPLNANQRLHWRQRAQRVALIRDAVMLLARRLPFQLLPGQRLVVQLHYRPGDNRRRDASNLVPTQKPAVDGLVRAGIVPDDTAEWVTEKMPELHPGKGQRRLWLTLAVAS